MSDWAIDQLADLVHIQKGKKVETSEFQLPGYDAYLGASSLAGVNNTYASIHLSITANENDVLMLWDGERSGLVGHNLKGIVSSTVAKLSPNGKIISTLLYYYLLHSFEWIQNRRTGTGVPHVPKDLVRILKLRYPKEKKYQKKISVILEKIDQSIKKTEALIHKYQQIKAGLMHDLFTRGVTADGKLRPPREQAPDLYKKTPIGWIPKGWEAKRLGNILEDSGSYLQTGPFGSQLHAHEYTYEGVPVVMPQNINDGKIDSTDIARIPEKRAQILYKHRLKIGDIIISRRGELNRAAAVTEIEKTWVCGTGCFLLRSGGSKLDSTFFSYIYSHDIVQRQIAGLAVGSTMPSLNNTVMNVLYFPCVEKNEQKRISERLKIVEQHIEALFEQKFKLLKQKSGLMEDLLTGKVQVKTNQEEPCHV
ncbi:MAG: restriction endonuclease subunit S [Desulfobacterium sp.]|jgi:type I restriction enzyme S subunit|nr:restriction endonuclease subunit S [Desulfobacterium sp.]